MSEKTNRFFYSEKQATINGVNDANEVFNGTEWVKYSELISKGFEHLTSNWDDAILVFETEEDYSPIKINPLMDDLFGNNEEEYLDELEDE